MAEDERRWWPRLPMWLIVAAVVFFAVDMGYYYGRLPARVATHFDAHGRPDGWSGKEQFIGMMAGMLLLVAVSLSVIGPIVRFAPPSLINLPHKEYWLAPEREVTTRRAIARWGLWFAAATLWFMVLLSHETLQANLRQPPQLRAMWGLLAGYLVVVVWSVGSLTWKFARVPRSSDAIETR